MLSLQRRSTSVARRITNFPFNSATSAAAAAADARDQAASCSTHLLAQRRAELVMLTRQ